MPNSEEIKAKAERMWEEMDDNQRHGVRFGLFPAEVMRAAEDEGFTFKVMAVPLMDVAQRKGGMRA